MEIKKILWPTDLSGNAEKALPLITSLSKRFKSEIHILYVMEEFAIHEPWYGEFGSSHVRKIQEWERLRAGERLDWICEEFLQNCPLYIKHIAIGDPADEILKFIPRESIDMVVMAKQGRRKKFAFGSVTEKVIRNASVPVSVVPGEENA